jgi:uncharacterized DUF497 family protein
MAEDFEWDRFNLAEIAHHQLYPADVEDALEDRNAVERPAYAETEPRWRVIVATPTGRILGVVFTLRGERIRVVSAWPASPADQRRYRGEP